MSNAELKTYFQNRLIIKQPNTFLDSRLQSATVDFLQTVGLPNEKELNFSFDEYLRELPNSLIQLHSLGDVRPLYLDPHQDDALFCSSEPDENSFVNSSAQQFVQCLYEFEQFINTVYTLKKFGEVYAEHTGKQNRLTYAVNLEARFQAVDPTIFERGYYWPAFLEDIENGLL